MSELLRWPSFVLVFSTIVLSGWLHALWSGRWEPEQELAQAVARVADVPMTVGEWQAESMTVDESDFFQAGALSYWARRYTHARTKEAVMVVLMCGRPGRMSVHNPEVCYQGAGFTMVGTAEPMTVTWQNISTDSSATLWTASFRKDGDNPEPLRLLWGWNSRGNWQALKAPRWETKDDPFLYKMYVSLEGSGSEPRRPGTPQQQQPTTLNQAEEFLLEFMPKLQRTLFPEREEPSQQQ